MPYNYPGKVPNYLKNLPEGAQKIFIAAFNTEFRRSKNEEKARQAGWGAVKNKYKKVGDKWIMKNQQLYIMQVPFDGGIIRDETKLRQLFGDKYDDAVSFEQQLKKDDPKYFGEGKPFVVGGYFLKYQEIGAEKLTFIATDGTRNWIYRKDFEQHILSGEFNGLPMHKGHTKYPEDPNEWKEPFGSVLATEVRPEGAYGYYYIFASESKLRKDISNSRAIGFERAPIRDLSSQFFATEFVEETKQIKKIKATSVDLVYKKLAAMPGSGFESIIANQFNDKEYEMERIDVLKTLTIDELESCPDTKPLVLKLQEKAREGYVKVEEIVSRIEKDETIRNKVIACQAVIKGVKEADNALATKKTNFEKDGKTFLNQKGISDEDSTKILTDLGENMSYDLVKLQEWYGQAEKLGFKFQSKGSSTTDSEDKLKVNDENRVTPEKVTKYIDNL
jgi:cation transport regulator ChaB